MDLTTPQQETVMKKLVPVLLIAFLGFWMYQDPSGLADVAGTAGATTADVTETAAMTLIDFIQALVS